ncbi:hypothetical protein D3C85_1774230 [compost metagenome]
MAASASQDVWTVEAASAELVIANTRKPDSITVSVNSNTRPARPSVMRSPLSGMLTVNSPNVGCTSVPALPVSQAATSESR